MSSRGQTIENHQPDAPNTRSVRLYAVVALLALIGLTDAVYLTVQYLTGQTARCMVSSGCSVVLSSEFAKPFGIPLSGIGALAYFLAFSLATLVAFGYKQAKPMLTLLVLCMLATTFYLLYLMFFVLHARCDYCLISATVTITASALVIGDRFRSRRPNHSHSPSV